MVSPEGRRIVLEKYAGRCAYCGCALTEKTMTLDHFIPQTRLKKQKKPSPWDNFLPSCAACNILKGCKDIKTARMYFRQMVNGFLKRAGREEILARDFKFLFEDEKFLAKLPKARKAAIARNKARKLKAAQKQMRHDQIKSNLEGLSNEELLDKVCQLRDRVKSLNSGMSKQQNRIKNLESKLPHKKKKKNKKKTAEKKG